MFHTSSVVVSDHDTRVSVSASCQNRPSLPCCCCHSCPNTTYRQRTRPRLTISRQPLILDFQPSTLNSQCRLPLAGSVSSEHPTTSDRAVSTSLPRWISPNSQHATLHPVTFTHPPLQARPSTLPSQSSLNGTLLVPSKSPRSTFTSTNPIRL